jgi:hypothetical protein
MQELAALNDDELEIIKAYIMIQKMRFKDRFDVIFQFSPITLECIVPKMILQPIVENAVFHGIEPNMKNSDLFISSDIDEDNTLIFTPHYKQYTERYGIYWILVEENSEELKKYIIEKQHSDKIKAAEIDSIQIGNDQYELSHHISSINTEAGDRDGFHYRVARNSGWFSYEMKVSNEEDTYIQFSYLPMQCKNNFDVYINDSLISHEVRGNKHPYELTERTYLIPKELYGSNTSVVVSFKANADDETGRIVNLIRTTKKV